MLLSSVLAVLPLLGERASAQPTSSLSKCSPRGLLGVSHLMVELAHRDGTNDWGAALQKAKAMVGKMTLEEKVFTHES